MRSKVLIGLLACAALDAQTFEAASIKTAVPLGPAGMQSDQNGGPGTTDPGLFTCKNCSLYWLLADVYPIHGYDFSGPDWLQSVRFDVTAKVPAGATKEDFHKMLENLFVQRFQMAFHREPWTMQVFELTVGKNGPKFHEGTPKDAPKEDAGRHPRVDAEGFPILAPGVSMSMRPGHARLQSENRPLAWFVEMLATQLGSPVIDQTGLKGTYDFMVSWAWDESKGSIDVRAEAASALSEAVQSQLGLKLERKKGQSEVLVIDHIEKVPTEN